jgi:hypothetical protein
MQRETVLVLVKTYPTLSKTYGELSCVAGIREDGSWIRLYPIPFRRLKEEYRFEKYRWIELPIEKNTRDSRPESYRPVDLSQIKQLQLVATSNGWFDRKQLVLKKLVCYTDMTQLAAKAKQNELSLALFKPTEVVDFIWEPVDKEWDRKKIEKVLADLSQGTLFNHDEFLEDFTIADKLPFKFCYIFKDSNGTQSKMMIEDWEIGQLFRNCMRTANSENSAAEKVRQKYYDSFLSKTDLHLYIGTTRQWHGVAPNPFVIIGTFTPPKTTQMSFDF